MNRTTALLLLLLAALAACTPARREVDGFIVRDIEFKGNAGGFSGQNDLQLRRQMEQDESAWGLLIWPFLYWVDPKVLDEDLLPRDAYRLEVFYAHNGFFEARVAGWMMREIRPQTEKKAGVVDIVGYVMPGPPSFVRTFDIDGLPPSLALVGATVRREAEIEEGDQYSLEAVEDTRRALLLRLQNHARAYAEVETTMVAHPEEQAVDVTLTAEPGIQTVYGPITVHGNEKIRTKLIEQNFPIEEGEPYKLEELRDTRQRLFDMSTFSVVSVDPDLSDPTDPSVPIDVTVTEAKFQTLRLGGGFNYENGTPQPRLSARYRNVNLFNELIQLELFGSAGLAWLATNSDFNDIDLQPTYTLGTHLVYPRIAGQRVAIDFSARIEQDVSAGIWAYRQPQADLQVVWKPNPKLQVRVGPHAEQYEFLNITPESLQAARALFGTAGEFQNPYELTALDQFVTLDLRDDPITTTRGSYWSLHLREAAAITPNGYDYGRASGEMRLFRPVRFSREVDDYPFIAAGKLRATYMQPFSDRGVPYPELAFLGGANSIRGFRSRQVGPYDTLCVDDPNDEDPDLVHLPRGGTFAPETSLEVRYPWAYGITFAGFVDAGMLSPDPDDISFDDFRWSAGAGARYDTLIGPIRFDLSFRPLYPEDEGPETFVDCDPREGHPRAFDFFSSFPAIRDNPDQHPPFAMVFYLAIGEAF